jgi:transcriptional regulator with XRE-family HTH domain
MNIDIGTRLKEERERLKLSQAALAEIGGKKKLAQLKYEQGESSPTASYLAAAQRVGVDVLYVVTGERAAGLPAGLSAEEQLLLETYRALPTPERKKVLAGMLAGNAVKPVARKAPAGVVVTGNNNRTAGGNYDEK